MAILRCLGAGRTTSASLATIDIVLECEAVRIIDGPILERVAARCREAGWLVQVEVDAIRLRTAP